MPQQEKGTRPSLPLPYQLYATGRLSSDSRSLEIEMAAGNEMFAERAAGSAFHVYTPEKFRKRAELRTRAYAAAAGRKVTDTWALEGFADGIYDLRICGPNGFLRELMGSADDPLIDVRCEYALKTGDLECGDPDESWPKQSRFPEIVDHAYDHGNQSTTVNPGKTRTIRLDLKRSFSWYDFTVKVAGSDAFGRRFAGRVETGKPGFSDPVIGRQANARRG